MLPAPGDLHVSLPATMSMPTAVFLDTSILAGQHYNFSSTAFTTFVPACKKRGLKLLLPDPTEREVKRQIRTRSQEALDALEAARRKAPFLAKWKNFPERSRPSLDNWEVTRLANEEWRTFLIQFDVLRLGYEGLNLVTVMNWYDSVAAPFREGKKRKEFPDAFALALLDSYANKTACYVAVVSEDRDFKLACERFPNLLHFQSLPRLTEVLLMKEDQVSEIRESIDKGIAALEFAVRDELGGLSFYHVERRFEIYDTSLSEPSVIHFSVVAIGDYECTITFEAEFEAEHQLQWEEWSDSEEGSERIRRWIAESVTITGTAKVSFDPKAGNLAAVIYVTLDDSEVEVTKTPREYLVWLTLCSSGPTVAAQLSGR